jgi:hypothetical protein
MPASVAIHRILRRAASRKVTRAINKVVHKTPGSRERLRSDGAAMARPITCWLFAGGSDVPAAPRTSIAFSLTGQGPVPSFAKIDLQGLHVAE